MSEGRGGVFILGLDVPCDHVSKFLANDPVTAREYSVLETDSQKICRVPVMHFYEVLPSASK